MSRLLCRLGFHRFAWRSVAYDGFVLDRYKACRGCGRLM